MASTFTQNSKLTTISPVHALRSGAPFVGYDVEHIANPDAKNYKDQERRQIAEGTNHSQLAYFSDSTVLWCGKRDPRL
jgi:hypothetical protein